MSNTVIDDFCIRAKAADKQRLLSIRMASKTISVKEALVEKRLIERLIQSTWRPR